MSDAVVLGDEIRDTLPTELASLLTTYDWRTVAAVVIGSDWLDQWKRPAPVLPDHENTRPRLGFCENCVIGTGHNLTERNQ